MRKTDYSVIAANYDKARVMSRQNIELWLDMVATYSHAPTGARALDLGCGTGRFAIPMAEYLGYQVTGADASEAMLNKAAEKDSTGAVNWDHQNADSLNYEDKLFDIVFMSHLLHHVDDPQKVLKNCARILKSGGHVFIRYGAIEQIRNDAAHTFIPEIVAVDEARTPTVKQVEIWLNEAGFEKITSHDIRQKTFQSSADHLKAVKLKNNSVMSLIADDAFNRGVARMEKYIKDNPDDPWLLRDDLTLTYGVVK
ncbi:MAG: methyltransferase domain-containing protein [FCB group bacterium]|nr:methyltransferase domain-containing protein [FCB group bacterium]